LRANVTGHDRGRPRERSLQEIGRLETGVEDAELARLGRPQHAILHQRVLDDHLGRTDHADQVRQQLRPAPAGHQTERHLGQCERGRAG
jgi:hypothetical protein